MQILKKRIKDTKVKDQKRKKRRRKNIIGRRNDKSLKGQKLLDNSRRTKREKLSSMEKKEKRHVKRKSKVKGLSYEIINEDTEDVKLPEKKRQKKEKKTSFEVTDEEKPGCSHQLGKFVVFD